MSARKDNELYETKDIKARPLLIFVSGLTIMCICVFLTVHSLQKSITRDLVQERGADHPMAGQRTAPRGPLLQAHPTREIEELMVVEENTLSTFAWIDSQAGIVRLPIELAMQVYLERQSDAQQGAGE